MEATHSESRTVVGVAVVHRGRVLAAERSEGGWELPGGKVEPGEDHAAAARRELVEELDLRPEPLGPLPGTAPISSALVLRVHVARLDDDHPGTVRSRVHRAVRWLGPRELLDVAWLPADLPFVPRLRALLDGRLGGSLTAGFDEREPADAVVRALAHDDVVAAVRRQGFAGEDDSDDRPWLVSVSGVGPSAALRALVRDVEHAWLEDPALPAPPAAPPWPLPASPRRRHR